MAGQRHPWLAPWESLDHRARGVYLTQQAIVATVTLEVYGTHGGRAMSAALGLVFRTALVQTRLGGRDG